jgi:hypothetical protein
VFTKPLPSTERRDTFNRAVALKTIEGIHIETHRLMEGIYEVRRRDGLRYNDYIKNVVKTGSAIQKLIVEDTQTCSMEIT